MEYHVWYNSNVKKRYIVIIIVLLLAVGGYLYIRTLKTTSVHQNDQFTKKRVLPKEATVTLDKKGFSPDVLTIKEGSAVRWKNESGEKQTVNSDEYPTNQLHKELNFGIFNNNSSVVYIFKKPGTYGYHNQFHPEQKGKVIVER